jgi:hypothetical protein
MEEAAFLAAVQRVVGGIQVEDDLLRRRLVRVETELDEQPLDRRTVVSDLVVARRLARRRMLKPVERALSCHRRAVLPPGSELAREDRHHRVVPKLIVVDKVLVAQCDSDNPLADQRRHRVLNLSLRPAVAEAGGKALDEPDCPVRGSQQQRTSIRGHCPAVERRHHTAALDHSKRECLCATLCRHRGAPLRRRKSLLQKNYRRFRAPMHLLRVRNPG